MPAGACCGNVAAAAAAAHRGVGLGHLDPLRLGHSRANDCSGDAIPVLPLGGGSGAGHGQGLQHLAWSAFLGGSRGQRPQYLAPAERLPKQTLTPDGPMLPNGTVRIADPERQAWPVPQQDLGPGQSDGGGLQPRGPDTAYSAEHFEMDPVAKKRVKEPCFGHRAAWREHFHLPVRYCVNEEPPRPQLLKLSPRKTGLPSQAETLRLPPKTKPERHRAPLTPKPEDGGIPAGAGIEQYDNYVVII
mmetsp:Transcript_69548/g.196151  ORF Transcript_69548/g.196151 Transcript_69548/m.196151 type:complete len:245 (+) Transcript_69548:63-797(+)